MSPSTCIGAVLKPMVLDFTRVSDVIDEILDSPSLGRKGCSPLGFRSNGYRVQVFFMMLKSSTPPVPRTNKLSRAGCNRAGSIVVVKREMKDLSLLSERRLEAKRAPRCASVVLVRRWFINECCDPRPSKKPARHRKYEESNICEESAIMIVETRDFA